MRTPHSHLRRVTMNTEALRLTLLTARRPVSDARVTTKLRSISFAFLAAGLLLHFEAPTVQALSLCRTGISTADSAPSSIWLPRDHSKRDRWDDAERAYND